MRFVRNFNTGTDGSYVAAYLPVGHYQVVVEAQGFKKQLTNNIVLNVNDHRIVDAQLQVGGTDQVVSVEESPLGVDLETSEAAGLVNGTQVRELALATRNSSSCWCCSLGYRQLLPLTSCLSASLRLLDSPPR